MTNVFHISYVITSHSLQLLPLIGRKDKSKQSWKALPQSVASSSSLLEARAFGSELKTWARAGTISELLSKLELELEFAKSVEHAELKLKLW